MRTVREIAFVLVGLAACAKKDMPSADVSPSSVGSAPAPLPIAPPLASPVQAAPTHTAPECPPPQRIDPARLAAEWPSLVGKRVTFAARIERAIDVIQSLAVARGTRFVVVMSPEQTWQGEATKTFVVMGSAKVALGGQVTLPQLMLQKDGECGP